MTNTLALRAIGRVAAWLSIAVTSTTQVGCAPEPQHSPPPNIYHADPLAAFDRVDRVVVADDGGPQFVRGVLGRVPRPIDGVEDANLHAMAVLDAVAAPIGLSAADFVAYRVTKDANGGTHVRYRQQLNGLSVVGGELIVHVTYGGLVQAITYGARAYPGMRAVPAVDRAAAVEIAETGTLAGASRARSAELVYLRDDSSQTAQLVWQIEVVGRDELVIDRVFVDAFIGTIVARHSRVWTARDRVVKDGDGQESILAILFSTTVGTEESPPTGDPIASAAFENTGLMYDCYADLYGRDSYDDLGATLTSIVHVTFQGSGNNAAWAGDTMLYGDGDGSLLAELAYAYDVTAHELTHGVISATANLTYMNESGAINEGWADIMAATCEAWNDGGVTDATWLVGEDVFTPGVEGDALRYMGNPTADSDLYPPELGGSRDYYPDRYTGVEDNGGVHLNSGIANLAFKLLVTGGSHPRVDTGITVLPMEIEQAGEIFLSALENYMTSGTNFAHARVATEEAAMALYGATEAAKVGLAWAAVGVGDVPAVDDVPPTVEITSPADGGTVGAGFEVHVNASDDQQVASVEVFVDGVSIGTAIAPPYVFVTDASLGTGRHSVRAVASDGVQEASVEIDVTIGTPGCSGDDCGGNPDGPACTNDADCPGGHFCEDGVCSDAGGASGADDTGGCNAVRGHSRGSLFATLLALFAVVVVRRSSRATRLVK